MKDLVVKTNGKEKKEMTMKVFIGDLLVMELPFQPTGLASSGKALQWNSHGWAGLNHPKVNGNSKIMVMAYSR